MKRYPTTPLGLKLGIAFVLIGAFGWWGLDRADRLGNERRLSSIASQIAGRDVEVHCPGPIGRALGQDTLEGRGRRARPAPGRPALPLAEAERREVLR